MENNETWKTESFERQPSTPSRETDGPSSMSGDFSSGLGTGLGIALGILGATWLFTRLAK